MNVIISKMTMEWIVQKQLDAYNKRDLAEFLSCFHDEVCVTQLVSKTTSSGKELFTQRYKTLFENNKNLHCELKSRIILNTVIIDEEWVTGASAFPQGLHTIAIYSFRDNLIDRVWFPR